jgi:hypothetical protein
MVEFTATEFGCSLEHKNVGQDEIEAIAFAFMFGPIRRRRGLVVLAREDQRCRQHARKCGSSHGISRSGEQIRLSPSDPQARLDTAQSHCDEQLPVLTAERTVDVSRRDLLVVAQIRQRVVAL